MAPEGVAIASTVVHTPITQDTVEQLSQVGDYVVDAAKVLASLKCVPAEIAFHGGPPSSRK